MFRGRGEGRIINADKLILRSVSNRCPSNCLFLINLCTQIPANGKGFKWTLEICTNFADTTLLRMRKLFCVSRPLFKPINHYFCSCCCSTAYLVKGYALFFICSCPLFATWHAVKMKPMLQRLVAYKHRQSRPAAHLTIVVDFAHRISEFSEFSEFYINSCI